MIDVSSLAPGLHATCPTEGCGEVLSWPVMVADGGAEPCLLLKADVTCVGCGGVHRLVVSMVPDVNNTKLFDTKP